MSIFVGEALVGDGNEVAHIDLLIGDKTGPVGAAFANALCRQSAGHSNLLAVLEQEQIEIHRILREMTQRLRGERAAIAAALLTLAQLELLFAKALFGARFGCSIPLFNAEGVFELRLKNARHANAMAARLGDGLAAIPGVTLPHPVAANELFPALPRAVIDGLKADGFGFYEFPGDTIRLVCAYNTKSEDVDAFLASARAYADAAAAE